MKKIHALLMITDPVYRYLNASAWSMLRATQLCNTGPRSVIPIKFDKTPKPLREMFDTGERPEPARGGKDFEPGRPQPVGNRNTPFTDPLADKSVGLPSALAEIKASTNGTPVDPAARVAPPDTTGDVGPNHYVQWVNLRYSIYTLTRDVNNEITAFMPVPGFPKNGNVVMAGFWRSLPDRQRRRSDRSVRSVGRSLDIDPVCRLSHAIHSVRGCFDKS